MREGFAFIEYPYSKEIVKVPDTLEKDSWRKIKTIAIIYWENNK